jgi:hypothetical protein
MVLRRLTGRTLLVIPATALVMVAASLPAPAQSFDERYPSPSFENRQPRQSPRRHFHPPHRRAREREPATDYSKAPPPRQHETTPTVSVLVLGDSMADWLGFGLEEAFAESPEIGVTRKPRPNCGLIKIETRSEPYDVVAAAKEIIAAEKPDFIVIMLGSADRQWIRERHVRTPAQPGPGTPIAPSTPSPRPSGDAENASQEPPPVAPPADPGPSGVTLHEFRSKKWAELYDMRIDQLIAVLKSKGVPVFWVGLPPIRGRRSTADMVYLNELYRSHAEKAGITYVDVWEGFVDEDGDYVARGPDFEGQVRRLRPADGVHFTNVGARKLAHYVEREVRRIIQARTAPVALPVPEREPAHPPSGARPDVPMPRPVAGPIVPLTGPTTTSEGLFGAGSPPRTPASDPLVDRVLVKGESVPAPTGRADDFAWPRRDGLPAPTVDAAEPATEPAPHLPSAVKLAPTAAR